MNLDPYAYTPERLAIWQRYVHDDCQTTRAAGFVWVRDCYFAEEWETSTEDLPVPEHQTLKDLLAHYMAARGNYVNLPRDRVCKDARRYLEAYYKVPLKPDSKELAKARVRMVREMILEGYFETSKTRGLEVSEFEEAQALLGLTPNVYKGEYSQGWRLLEPPVGANFYQMKNIEWKGVVNWSGVEVHKLPLRPAEDLPEMTESEDESMDSDIQESDDGDYIMDEDAFSEEEHFHQGGEADINEV